jgi:GT2 family glycosyltransferase
MRVVPAAVLYHKVSRSEEKPNPRVLYYLTRNRFLLLRAHLPWHRQLIALPWTLWGQLRTAINLVRMRDWQRQRALLWGIRDAALGRTGATQIVW